MRRRVRITKLTLETRQFEANAMVNLRPGKNDSTEILDSEKRAKFLELARKVLTDYVA